MKKYLTLQNIIGFVIAVFFVGFIVNLYYVFKHPDIYVGMGHVDANATLTKVETWAMRGQIGDILAGHFAAISVLLIFWGLMKQQEEIGLQVKEMRQQKVEFEKSNILATYERYFTRLGELVNSTELELVDASGVYTVSIDGLANTLDAQLYKATVTVPSKITAILALCAHIHKTIMTMNSNHDEMKGLLLDDLALYLRQMGFMDMTAAFVMTFAAHLPKSQYGIQGLIGAFDKTCKAKVTQLELGEIVMKLFEGTTAHWRKPSKKEVVESGIIQMLYPDLFDVYVRKI